MIAFVYDSHAMKERRMMEGCRMPGAFTVPHRELADLLGVHHSTLRMFRKRHFPDQYEFHADPGRSHPRPRAGAGPGDPVLHAARLLASLGDPVTVKAVAGLARTSERVVRRLRNQYEDSGDWPV
jgi:hypothetical protein